MALRPWIAAARPKTLTAALVPVVVGSVLGAKLSPSAEFAWFVSIAALISATAIQIGTNFFNDVIDFEKGADTAARIGPTRITQSGGASPALVYKAAIGAFLIALLFGAYLVWHGGTPILLIGLLSLLFGYTYTGGPYPLAYRGLGDLFVLIFFGLVAVSGTVFLHTGTWSMSGLVAGWQIGSLAVVLIAINNLRDRETDSGVDKRTLAVVLGERGAKIEIAGLLVVPFLAGFYWVQTPWSWAAVLPLILFPHALRVAREIWSIRPSAELNRYLGRCAFIHLGFGLLLTLGFILGGVPHGN
jgi:1,4-dihydroxy-2-naphthoate octaprenyltransferase